MTQPARKGIPTRRRQAAASDQRTFGSDQRTFGSDLRSWLHDVEQAMSRRAAAAKRRAADRKPDGTRGIDRVPDRLRVDAPAPVYLVRHEVGPFQPYRNPKRAARLARSGRLRKDLPR